MKNVSSKKCFFECLEIGPALDFCRQDLIDSERIKLLKEHGPKLLGFIPRGTIKSQEELDQLGEPFLTYYRDGAQFREPAPFTIGATPCEEELYRNMELPKNAKY